MPEEVSIIKERQRLREGESNSFVDPKQFIDAFVDSEYFYGGITPIESGEHISGFDDYLEGVGDADATEVEKLRAFQESDDAKLLLLYWVKHGKGRYDYEESYLRANGFGEVVDACDSYVSTTEAFLKSTGGMKEQADFRRGLAHSVLANRLMKSNIVPIERLGRGLASVMLAERVSESGIDEALRNEAGRLSRLARAIESRQSLRD